jgi:hypothetical protein
VVRRSARPAPPATRRHPWPGRVVIETDQGGQYPLGGEPPRPRSDRTRRRLLRRLRARPSPKPSRRPVLDRRTRQRHRTDHDQDRLHVQTISVCR